MRDEPKSKAPSSKGNQQFANYIQSRKVNLQSQFQNLQERFQNQVKLSDSKDKSLKRGGSQQHPQQPSPLNANGLNVNSLNADSLNAHREAYQSNLQNQSKSSNNNSVNASSSVNAKGSMSNNISNSNTPRVISSQVLTPA